ncbi:unnamed protein product, partial [Oppiella nova]
TEPSTAKRTTSPASAPVVESASFVMNLFRGEAKVQQQFPYPHVLTADDLQMVDMVTEPIVRQWAPDDALRYEANEAFDDKLVDTMSEMGLLGIQVPTELGGIGMNTTQYARIGEILCRYDLGLAVFTAAHQAIGYKGILLFGTDDQKRRFVPDLATGKRIACFCLTEPGVGSDASSIQTRAQLSPDGKHYVLNGTKIWISNGGIADVFTVFARVGDQTAAFIVERGPGVTSGPPHKKMGIKASNTTDVYFDSVKVPVENLLGPVGEGFKIAMNVLNNGRFA